MNNSKALLAFTLLACATTAQGMYRPYGGYDIYGGQHVYNRLAEAQQMVNSLLAQQKRRQNRSYSFTPSQITKGKRILERASRVDFCKETAGGIDELRLTNRENITRSTSTKINGKSLFYGDSIDLNKFKIVKKMGDDLAKVETIISVKSIQFARYSFVPNSVINFKVSYIRKLSRPNGQNKVVKTIDYQDIATKFSANI